MDSFLLDEDEGKYNEESHTEKQMRHKNRYDSNLLVQDSNSQRD